MTFTGASYKLAESGFLAVVQARDALRRLVCKGDSNDSFESANYLSAGWYDASRPAGGLAGFWRNGQISGSITPISVVLDSGALVDQGTVFPWRSGGGNTHSDGASSFGQFWGMGTAGQGLLQAGCNPLKWPAAHGTIASGSLLMRASLLAPGSGFFAMGPICGTPDWAADSLDVTTVWYEPANAVPTGFTGGPSLSFAYRRDLSGGEIRSLGTIAGGTSGGVRSKVVTIPGITQVALASVSAAATPVFTTTANHNLFYGSKVVVVNSSARTSGGASIDGEYAVSGSNLTATTFSLTGCPGLAGGTAGTAQGYVTEGPCGTVTLAIYSNATEADKAFVPMGWLFERHGATQGLTIIPLGNPEFRTTDWLASGVANKTAVLDATLAAIYAAIGTIHGLVINVGHNMTTGTAADGTANDEAGTLGLGDTSTFKANIKAMIARDRSLLGPIPVCLQTPYYFDSAGAAHPYTAYDTLVQACKEVCDEISGVCMVNFYHNGGGPEFALSTNDAHNTINDGSNTTGSNNNGSGTANRHVSLNGHWRAISFFWSQVYAAEYAAITAGHRARPRGRP